MRFLKKHCIAYLRKNLKDRKNSIILEALKCWLLTSTTQLQQHERQFTYSKMEYVLSDAESHLYLSCE